MSFAVWILASVFVAAGANKCDVSHMQKCIGPLSGSQMDFNKPEQACKTLGDVKTCLEAMKGRCPGLRASIDSGLAGVNQQYSTYCSTTGCSAVKFMKCQNMLPNLKSEGAPTKENCESLSKAIKCFEQVLTTCPEGTEKKMNTQQLNQLKMMFQMCSSRTPGGAGPTSGSPRTPGGAGPTSGSPRTPGGAGPTSGSPRTPGGAGPTSGSPRTPGGAGPTSGSPRTPGGAGPTSASPMECSALMLKCTGMIKAEDMNDSPTVAKCNPLIQAVRCLQALRPNCESVMASGIDQTLSSVQPQYQICINLGKDGNEQNSTTAASPLGSKAQTTSMPMGNEPSKPGAAGKKTTAKPDSHDKDVGHSKTKKPKKHKDHDHKYHSEEEDEDDKKSPNTGGNGSSLVTASFLVTAIAVGILALAQRQL